MRLFAKYNIDGFQRALIRQFGKLKHALGKILFRFAIETTVCDSHFCFSCAFRCNFHCYMNGFGVHKHIFIYLWQFFSQFFLLIFNATKT